MSWKGKKKQAVDLNCYQLLCYWYSTYWIVLAQAIRSHDYDSVCIRLSLNIIDGSLSVGLFAVMYLSKLHIYPRCAYK